MAHSSNSSESNSSGSHIGLLNSGSVECSSPRATENKPLRIVIVGAGGELGSALSERYARKSAAHRIVMAGRSRRQLEKVLENCRTKATLGTELQTVQIDVRKEASCKAMIDASIAALGGIDLLIYAATKDVRGNFDEIEDFVKTTNEVMETTFYGAVYCISHALPHLRASQGQLVAFPTTTIDGKRVSSIYLAARHALKGFFDTLRHEELGITITLIQELKTSDSASSPSASPLITPLIPPPFASASAPVVSASGPLSRDKDGEEGGGGSVSRLSAGEIVREIQKESKGQGFSVGMESRTRTSTLRLPKVVQLQEAIKRGSPELIKAALKDFPAGAIDAVDEQLRTPLHLAALFCPDAVKVILKKKACLSLKDRDGYTPLLLAAAGGQIKSLLVLLTKCGYPDTKATSNAGETLLHLIASYCNNPASNGAPPSSPPTPALPLGLNSIPSNSSPLVSLPPNTARLSANSSTVSPRPAASPRGSVVGLSPSNSSDFIRDLLKILKSLQEKGHLDLDSKDEVGATPLHRACEAGNLEMTSFLLRNGAAVNLVDKAGESPLHYAVRGGNRGVVRYLLESNADVSLQNTSGQKAFEVPDISTKVQDAWKTWQDSQEKKNSHSPPTESLKPKAERTKSAIFMPSSARSARASILTLRKSKVPEDRDKDKEVNSYHTPIEDESEVKKKERIVIRTFEELPKEYHSNIKKADLDFEKVAQNWSVFVHVLRFVTRKNFRDHAENSDIIQHNSSGHLSLEDTDTSNNTESQSEEGEKEEETKDGEDKLGGKKRRREPKSKSNVQTSIRQASAQFLLFDNPKKTYKMLEQAGKGGFGSVYAARTTDKKRYAIKKMSHKTAKERRSNLDEVIFLKQCEHPNIVKLYQSYDVGDEIWLVMEFMEGGSLQEAVTLCKFKENQIAYVAKEMLKGISYLHSKGLIHRDLKSANVMMNVEGDVKLIDFGLCVDSNFHRSSHMVGSPFWIPPEMIKSQIHGKEVDIWSFAICIIEMGNGKPPNHRSALRAMFQAVVEPPPSLDDSSWSSLFADFLALCLKQDPKERPSADELLKHEFLTKAATKKSMNSILASIFVEKSIGQSLGLGL